MQPMSRRTFLMAGTGALALLGAQRLLSGSAGNDTPAIFDTTELRPVRGAWRALGTTVTITALHRDHAVARAAVCVALERIVRVDRLMSLYRPDSQVSLLNRRGRLDDPDPALVEVLRCAQTIAEQSAGAFDITVQPLWERALHDRLAGRVAPPAALEQARRLVDWRKLVVSPRRLRFGQSSMALTLNGIAQGYATDCALAALRAYGIEDALVDAGEIGVLGANARRQPWQIGIQHPRQPEALLGVVRGDGRAVATSGDYATSFSVDYSRHHIFDPATGGSPTEVSSVTVLAPTAMEADALATAVFVLGVERGCTLCQALPATDAIMMRKNGVLVQTGAAVQPVAATG